MFDWASFLVLAQELAQRSDEASHRSAVSRAYYAIFNKARLLLEGEGIAVSHTGRAHDDVWRTLEGAGRGRRRLGAEGKRLREMRRKADYAAAVPMLERVLEDALATAEGMSKLVDAEATSRAAR